LDISSIVLAGGEGKRLGCDKILETIGCKSLIQQTISNLVFLNSDIIIVTALKRSFPEFAEHPRLKIVSDIYPGKGPLIGIYTGLSISDSLYNLVIACDMPFLNEGLLHYMMQVSPDFDIVVPRLGKLVEPLHAVYSKACLPTIEQMLEQDNLSVHKLLAKVKTRYVETEEINRFDPEQLSFFNINTESDLNKARALIENNSPV